MDVTYTPENQHVPLKRDQFNRKYTFQNLIFRGHSFVFGGVTHFQLETLDGTWHQFCWLSKMVKITTKKGYDYDEHHITSPTSSLRTPPKKIAISINFQVERRHVSGSRPSRHHATPKSWGGKFSIRKKINETSRNTSNMETKKTEPTQKPIKSCEKPYLNKQKGNLMMGG